MSPKGWFKSRFVPNEGAANLEITNTGPDIGEEVLSRVFDPFFRGDPSHTREVDGSGLGLAIVKWIVTAHRGKITMTSRPGGPTQVRVSFPLQMRKVGTPKND